MKSLAILLFMMVIRYSSAGYIVTHNDSEKEDRRTFDLFNCLTSYQPVLDILEATAAQMDRLVGYLEKGNGVPNDVLDEYKAAVALERKTVRKYTYDWTDNRDINPACRLSKMTAGFIAGNYKMLLEWDSSNTPRILYDDFRRIVERHKEFFHTPSATLDKYYAMKQNECYSFINFYKNGGEDIYDKPTENPFGESAEAGFECPKKKRESGSAVASKLNAQVLVIFLCMVIGIFVVHLQPWFENGEHELRSKERALVRVQRYFPREEGFLLGSVEVEVDCNLQSGEE